MDLSNLEMLWFRKFFSRIDWAREAAGRVQAEDWLGLAECVKNDLSLLNQKILMEQTPLFWAIEGGSLLAVQKMVTLGADVNALATKLIDFSSPHDPTHDLIPVTVLAFAWHWQESEIFAFLKQKVSAETRYITWITALRTGQESLANEFDENEVKKILFSKDSFKKVHLPTSPLVAALLGNISLALFKKVWNLTSEIDRQKHVSLSTSAPGHEEGIAPILEGDLKYWATYCKRPDVLDFLKGLTRT